MTTKRGLSTVAALAMLPALVPLTSHAGASTTWWHPGPLTSWAYVIGEPYPLTIPPIVDGSPTDVQAVDADVGDQDGLSASGAPLADPTIESSVAAIHSMGGKAICYVDAGTAEDWRSDYAKFDPSELGGDVPGWPGEEFINVADWSTPVPATYETLQTIMTNRVNLCKEEGFDAIEADNVDAYTDGDIGNFTLTMAQEETYVDEMVTVAHDDGLAFFLKNEVNGDSLLSTEAPLVDGEIDEQCWQYDECSALSIFVQEGKPILNVEYESFSEAALCPEALAFPMATIQAGVDLTGHVNYGCWQYRATSTTSIPSTTIPAPSTTATRPTPTSAKGPGATPTSRPVTTTSQSPPTTAKPGKASPSPQVPSKRRRRAPAFTNTPKVKAFAGRRFADRLATRGSPAPTLGHSPLPKGLHWSGTGKGSAVISGTPALASAGVRKVFLRASNALGTARRVLTIVVLARASLSHLQPPVAIVGHRYRFVVRANGYPTPSVSEEGALPRGVALSHNEGTIALYGEPKVGTAGTYHFSITVSNTLGRERALCSLTVTKALVL